MIQNPLNEIVPARYRKFVYALLSLASVAFTVWKASNGDWTEFTGGILTALGFTTAASNTSSSSPDYLQADHNAEPEHAEDEYPDEVDPQI